MALHKKKKFAELCGMKSLANLSNAIRRGKVIVSGDYIDDDILANSEYLEHQQYKNGYEPDTATVSTNNSTKDKSVTIPRISKPKSKGKQSTKNFKEPEEPTEEEKQDLKSKTALEKRKLELDIESKNHAVRLSELKIARMEGKVIPVDLVKPIFAQHFKSMTDSFFQSAENIATEMVKVLGGGRTEMSKIRSKLKDQINQSVIDGKKTSEIEIQNIINKYSESREKGERKN